MASVLDLVRPDGQLQGPARRAALLVGAFGVWTLLVWLTRVRNIVLDDSLSGGARTLRLLLAVLFVGGAVEVLVRLWQNRDRIRIRRDGSGSGRASVPRVLLRSVALLAVLTIVVWLFRGVSILFADHGGGFKLVHTLLALGSIALAAVTWQAVAPRSPAAPRHR